VKLNGFPLRSTISCVLSCSTLIVKSKHLHPSCRTMIVFLSHLIGFEIEFVRSLLFSVHDPPTDPVHLLPPSRALHLSITPQRADSASTSSIASDMSYASALTRTVSSALDVVRYLSSELGPYLNLSQDCIFYGGSGAALFLVKVRLLFLFLRSVHALSTPTGCITLSNLPLHSSSNKPFPSEYPPSLPTTLPGYLLRPQSRRRHLSGLDARCERPHLLPSQGSLPSTLLSCSAPTFQH
jgi:hypothetical protein